MLYETIVRRMLPSEITTISLKDFSMLYILASGTVPMIPKEKKGNAMVISKDTLIDATHGIKVKFGDEIKMVGENDYIYDIAERLLSYIGGGTYTKDNAEVTVSRESGYVDKYTRMIQNTNRLVNSPLHDKEFIAIDKWTKEIQSDFRTKVLILDRWFYNGVAHSHKTIDELILMLLNLENAIAYFVYNKIDFTEDVEGVLQKALEKYCDYLAPLPTTEALLNKQGLASLKDVVKQINAA